MKITAAERIAIGVTVILLTLVVGIFIGRNTVTGSVVVEAAAPEATAYVQPSTQASEVASPEVSVEVVAEQTAVTEASETEVADVSDTESMLWTPDSGELLDINLATLEELENLPEIGPVLAERIIEYRESNGAFHVIEDIKNVDGIGDKTYGTISVYLKVDEQNENSGS